MAETHLMGFGKMVTDNVKGFGTVVKNPNTKPVWHFLWERKHRNQWSAASKFGVGISNARDLILVKFVWSNLLTIVNTPHKT